jgi:large subunit ribosomal protein L20
MRALWIVRLNTAVRELGMKYSSLIKTMLDKKIDLDRKVLSQMAMENPAVFAKFIEKVK